MVQERDLFAERGIAPPGQESSQERDLFAERGIAPPEGLRTGRPAQQGWNFDLAEVGLEDDDYAQELVARAQETEPDTEEFDRAVSALVGYAVGRGRIDPQTQERFTEEREEGSLARTVGAPLRQFGAWSPIPLGDQGQALVRWAQGRLTGNDDRSFRAILAERQGVRRGMAAENRLAGAAGTAAGLLPGTVARAGGALVQRGAGLVAGQAGRQAAARAAAPATQAAEGLSRAVRATPGVGRAAQALDRTAEGRSAIGNLGRSAAQGALQAGAVTAAQDVSLENVPQAVLFGAVVAPGGELVARGVGRGAQAVGRRFNLDNAGYQALLRRLNTSPEVLEQRRQRFVRDNGRAPRLAELFDEDEAADISNILASSRRAAEQAGDVGQQAAIERQGTMRRTIQGSRRDFSPTQMSERRTAAFNRFMEQNADRAVAIDDDVAELLADDDVRRLVSGNPGLRRRIAEATAEDGDGVLTVRDMDTLRRLTRDAAQGGGPDAARYQPVSETIRAQVERDVPEYADALGEFRRRRITEEGYELGRTMRRPADVDEFNAQLRRADQRPGGAGVQEAGGISPRNAPGRAGARIGARQSLSRAAQESPQEAAGVARSLEADEGFRQRLASVFGVQEAGRMARAGANEARGARSLAALTPRARNTSQEDAQMVQTVIGAGVAAGGRASGAMIANVATQIGGYLKGDQTRARRLAAAMFDPGTADRAIARLKQLGLRNEAITDMYREAARAAGIMAGQSNADNNPAAPQDLRQ